MEKHWTEEEVVVAMRTMFEEAHASYEKQLALEPSSRGMLAEGMQKCAKAAAILSRGEGE
jgi:hypothetical protein